MERGSVGWEIKQEKGVKMFVRREESLIFNHCIELLKWAIVLVSKTQEDKETRKKKGASTNVGEKREIKSVFRDPDKHRIHAHIKMHSICSVSEDILALAES